MEYLIGSGALLERGSPARLLLASLHAQLDAGTNALGAVLIDFDGVSPAQTPRLLAVASGWTRPRFRDEVARPLLARGTCTLADVAAALACAVGTAEVHLFAHWLPAEETIDELDALGVRLTLHPVEAISAAAIVRDDGYARAA